MEDMAASAISPASKWESGPSDEERKRRRQRQAPEKPADEEPEAMETAEAHNVDELA